MLCFRSEQDFRDLQNSTNTKNATGDTYEKHRARCTSEVNGLSERYSFVGIYHITATYYASRKYYICESSALKLTRIFSHEGSFPQLRKYTKACEIVMLNKLETVS